MLITIHLLIIHVDDATFRHKNRLPPPQQLFLLADDQSLLIYCLECRRVISYSEDNGSGYLGVEKSKAWC